MLTIHSVPAFIKRLFPDYVWHIKTEEKIIYLTFDDGPIPVVTEFVLAQLAAFDAKATFFCVGDNISKHPEIFKRIVKEGHSIGNHTFNHLKGWQVKNDDYIENIRKFEEIVMRIVPEIQVILFRPPYGRITGSQAKILKEKYRIIMWDVLTCDYDRHLQPESCLRQSVKRTKEGSIVLFHDSLKAEKNMRYVLPEFLSHFAQKGYKFEPIGQ